jgi:hypothetical protein
MQRGVTLEGQKLLGETNPARPFGMLGTFYKKRLIELSYTLSTSSISVLLPILGEQYGLPDRLTRDRTGNVEFASWTGHEECLIVERVPVAPAIADPNFLHIGEGLATNAVRVRLQYDRTPPGAR